MKKLCVSMLLATAGLAISTSSQAAEGLVCTSTARYTIATEYGPPLTNGMRFNCGPNLLNVTIPEISAAGWIIIAITTSAFPGDPPQAATQLIIQK